MGVENNGLRYDSTKGYIYVGKVYLTVNSLQTKKFSTIPGLTQNSPKKNDFLFVLVCCMSLICLQEV